MKVKVSLIGIMDMLKFKNVVSEREKVIEAAPETPLPKTDRINELAELFHPHQQFLRIEKIVEENKDSKTFVLAPDKERGTERIAPFKAGSYLNISLKIGDSVASRVYSISSSPKESTYSITVKRKPGGFLSEYLLGQAKVGDPVTATEPGGAMTYSPLRDGRTVVAVAGGTGITPFLSMAKAIEEGTEDFNLVILYGARTRKDIIYRQEFDRISASTDKVKVVYVLSEEKAEGYEEGFITAELIQKHLPENGSVFAAGPVAMCEFLEKEVQKLGLAKKYVRIEQTQGQNDSAERQEYVLKVLCKGETEEMAMFSDETVLTALERNGIAAKNKCRVGGCGYCRSRLISGTYRADRHERLRAADSVFGYFHPCCSYPVSDMEIEIY